MICNKCQKPIEKDCASIPFCECLKILESEAAFYKQEMERLEKIIKKNCYCSFGGGLLCELCEGLKAHTQAIEEREKAK